MNLLYEVAGLSVKTQGGFKDSEFQKMLEALFTGEPSGHFILRRLQDAFDMIEALEQRVDELEHLLREK